MKPRIRQLSARTWLTMLLCMAGSLSLGTLRCYAGQEQRALAATTFGSDPSYLFGRADFATGKGSVAVVTADFNGDGKPDLATANQTDDTISILLGKPDGTFAAHVDYASGSGPSAIAVGDFGADGKLDLAVTNSTDNTVSILLGNGDGTFQSHVDYATGTKPSSVTSGDFNGDKKLDLAVASGIGVSVLLGNGDGTFQAHVDYATGTGGLPPQDVFITSVITADFNSDGKLDLAVANAAPQADFMPGSVSILLGNGDGTFRAHVDTPVVSPFSLATADDNGDGRLDVGTAGWRAVSVG